MEDLGEGQNCSQIPTISTNPRIQWKGHGGKQDIGPKVILVKNRGKLVLQRLQDDSIRQRLGLRTGKEFAWSEQNQIYPSDCSANCLLGQLLLKL